MSPTATGDRAAEFARLLNFFDQLASRGKKPQAAPDLRTDVGELPTSREESRISRLPEVPAIEAPKNDKLKDFYHATTSVKMFGNHPTPPWPSNRGSRSKQSRKVSQGSELSVTDSFKSESSYGEKEGDGSSARDGDANPPKFPLEKQRRFTFKLMLHKLYGRDDWMKKVQEALEQSKKEYKSLSECPKDNVPEKGRDVCGGRDGNWADDTQDGDHGGVGFTEQDISRHRRRKCFSIATYSVPIVGALKGGEERGDAVRAVKKRCVGRRKSLNSPLNAKTETGQLGSGWVYDAMFSQLEHDTHHDRGSLRGKGRRRSLSVTDRGVGPFDMARSRKRATTTTPAELRESIEEANLEPLATE